MRDNPVNWAGNFEYSAARWHRPESLTELQELVVNSARLKTVGTRHSFNPIADTPGDMVSLENFNRVVMLNPERRTVTIEAGVRYGELGRFLEGEGFALQNMASLPHISVIGACATATHGSGTGNACLAAAVSELELITASGEIRTFSREKDGDRFAGTVVGLGALGAVIRITLNIEPTYRVRQVVYENLPHSRMEAHLDMLLNSAYSVSLFSDWRVGVDRLPVWQVWQKHRITDGQVAPVAPPEWLGATLALENRHPIPGLPGENCTEQRGIPGSWNERLPHFRMEFTPSNGEELQSEYLVPRENALAALAALARLREQIVPLLQVCEVRAIAADDLWMSPFYRRDCVGFHFTWVKDWPAVRQLLPLLEEQLVPLEARPHWGKLFMLSGASLQALYPRIRDFQALRNHCDPERKFTNAFLEACLP